MVFQKKSSRQDHKYKFHLDTVAQERTKNNTFLGLNISTTGKFNKAVNELRYKARRAFYAAKRNIKFDIPIRIWLKILESVLEPITLYGNACRAELGRYPLIIKNPEKRCSILQTKLY